MGYSGWSADAYASLNTARSAAGYKTAFTHTHDVNTGKTKEKLHKKLNPKKVTRESRDSEQHPVSNAIAVLFDVTGSMGDIPYVLQKKLPSLMGMLARDGYVTDPQVLFGAVGDATCDDVPLQIGQFESGVEMDEDLSRIYVERGGGGQCTESYELGMYFMANRVVMDCLEKRGKKGYLFMIGDEMSYPKVSSRHIQKHIGDTVQADVSLEEVVESLKEKYEVFFIIPTNSSHGRDPKIQQFWQNLFGQNVLKIDNPDLICELIVTTIGLNEGFDIDSTFDRLGLNDSSKRSVSTAVSTVSRTISKVNTTGDLSKTSSGITKL